MRCEQLLSKRLTHWLVQIKTHKTSFEIQFGGGGLHALQTNHQQTMTSSLKTFSDVSNLASVPCLFLAWLQNFTQSTSCERTSMFILSLKDVKFEKISMGTLDRPNIVILSHKVQFVKVFTTMLKFGMGPLLNRCHVKRSFL